MRRHYTVISFVLGGKMSKIANSFIYRYLGDLCPHFSPPSVVFIQNHYYFKALILQYCRNAQLCAGNLFCSVILASSKIWRASQTGRFDRTPIAQGIRTEGV